MGCIFIKGNPEWRNYTKTNISTKKAIEMAEQGKFTHLCYCAGLWNNYIQPCDIEKLKSIVGWAALCDVYIHKDGHTLLIKGYSESDMF